VLSEQTVDNDAHGTPLCLQLLRSPRWLRDIAWNY